MPYQGRQPGVGVRSRYIYTASGGQTLFSGADDNGKTLAYQDGAYVDVYLNGVMLVPSTDFTATTKTSVTLTSGATASDILEIVAYDISSIADTVSALNGGSFGGNITVSGSVTATSFSGDGSALTGIEGVPAGVITMWSGSIASIPSGWVLCDGNNSTPDLRDRFVVGAGNTYAVAGTGGAASVTLSESEIPSHTHNITGNTSNDGAHNHTFTIGGNNAGSPYVQGSNLTDLGTFNGMSTAGAHSHTISGTAAATGGGGAHENRPPYYALAYIMKT